MVTIDNVTRGQVDFSYKGLKGKIGGEGLLPGYGDCDYVLYSNTFNNWNPPNESIPIDQNLKNEIINEIISAFKERGMQAQVE